ncbi:MAG: helix-turn-helix domain-containing protein [Chloroflexi bacterium]|nr:helix-turn-helix domain-containing protein [Chloroflexota bacterium]
MRTADSRQQATLTRLIGRLRDAAPVIARDVAADLGADVTAEAAEPVVRRFLAVIATGGVRVGEADLIRLRAEGAAAARGGQPLAASIDAYLSTAWVAWDHALMDIRQEAPDVLGALGAALLRAGDDIAAALADGYTVSERALAATAGATRQAILDELLTRGAGDPAALARLLRRAALVGFEPGMQVSLLVLRSGREPERNSDIVEELDRRLARDPARRAHLVAARGADVVAVVAGPTREEVPFDDLVAGMVPEVTWWAVVVGPLAIDGLAGAYAAAIDGLRVVPLVASPARVIRIADIALERALVADPELATAAAARWLGPLEAAGRGGPELIETLAAWLASGESVVATARALRVAPRTVSYRLARVAAVLGVRSLDAETRARLSAALLVRRLLARLPDTDDPRTGPDR